jgi:hypothetical protein
MYAVIRCGMADKRNVSACGGTYVIRMRLCLVFLFDYHPRTRPCLQGGNTSHHAQLSLLGGGINALYMGMLYNEAYLPLLAWDRIASCVSSR